MITAYKRKTTPIMALTEEDYNDLSKPGWDAIQKFKDNQGNHLAWFTVAYRLMFAFRIAAKHYELVTAVQLKLVFEKCIQVYEKAKASDWDNWEMSEELIEEISEALTALDTMQRQVLRKDLAEIIRKVVVEMRAKYLFGKKADPLPPKRIK